MSDWRETLKRLTKTPPAMGIEVVQLPIESFIEEMVGRYELYMRRQIAVHCDPDVLEQTARKNAELMAMLAEVEKKLANGELVEVIYGEWVYGENDIPHCSECGYEPGSISAYCPVCGADMCGGEDDAD